jgi:hypothetical protein
MGEAHQEEASHIEGLFKGIWTLEYLESDAEV